MSEAPRWRLNSAHYLNVETLQDGTRVEWEHKETSRENGRTVRKLFPVPMLLDPRDSADHNWPGEIIVTRSVDDARLDPRDIVFHGDPTPEMEALNPEAEAITAALQPRWAHPIDTLPINGGMSPAEQAFMTTMMEGFAKQIGAALPGANTAVPTDEVTELRARLAKLEAMIAAAPATSPERRV